ncbi:MAG: cytidylate kinase-like family protein [Leptonema sp. (in: Bacteria)]|nr:cytidylate kinase-like family protein [Leptonema sp. (in: bacteria)]
MPEHVILKYIRERRLAEFGPEIEPKEPGPVITIAREYGCPGFTLAERLAKTLSSKTLADNSVGEWKAINKGILKEVADHFELPESIIEETYRRAKPFDVINDLFLSTTGKSIPSDVKIRKKIADIILKMANDGRYIIVGRGGAMLARRIPQSLHLHLYAPLAWRAQQVSTKEEVSIEEAERRINEVDKERIYLRKYFSGEAPSDDFYDVTFNCESLSTDHIESAILDLLYSKRMIRSK